MSDCALPPGDPDAYRLLFEWNNEVIKRGELIPVPPQNRTPLYLYHHLAEIATKLHITPILDTSPGRYQYMLQTPSAFRNDDIQKVFTTLEKGHPLRVAIANGIADAWPTLYDHTKERINKIGNRVLEFENDLFARWGEKKKEQEETEASKGK